MLHRSEDPTVSTPPLAASPAMRQVALLIETSGSYGRGLLQGIAKYNRTRGGWSTYFRPHGLSDPLPTWLSKWKGDGLLVRIETQKVADLIAKVNVPTVNLRSTLEGLPFPYVGPDNAALARLAVQHLLDRGIKHFALCSRSRGKNPAIDERSDSFMQLIEKAGYSCNLFPSSSREIQWDQEQQHLTEWIKSLPKPVGVMAGNDERGLQVLDACRRAGAVVPDDVAVIGVDNDESLCDLAIPPLTSIDVNAEGIGYEAAALLDRMMSGNKPRAGSSQSASRRVPW